MSADGWQHVDACRACGARPEVFLELGKSPLANALLTRKADTARTYPLALSQCPDCDLVQNSVRLATSALFGADYPYLSSTSASVRRHFDGLAQAVADEVGADATALEIGSNDGVLQQALAARGIACTGVDPASKAVEIARSQGCRSYNMAFDAKTAPRLKEEIEPVDVAILCNVIAHVPAPAAVLRLIAQFLKPSGCVVVEFQSWYALTESGAFDMVYHEHHSHFSLNSFIHMANTAGFGVRQVEDIDTQGCSLRVWCMPGAPNAPEIAPLAARERAALDAARSGFVAGIDDFVASAQGFAEQFSGRTIAGYGAAAKTVTILSTACGALKPEFVADAAATKVGKFLPVDQIPIVSLEDLSHRKPDVIILFAWNLAREILPKLRGYEVWSPIPKLRRIQ